MYEALVIQSRVQCATICVTFSLGDSSSAAGHCYPIFGTYVALREHRGIRDSESGRPEGIIRSKHRYTGLK